MTARNHHQLQIQEFDYNTSENPYSLTLAEKGVKAIERKTV
jgi:hypothetical protein